SSGEDERKCADRLRDALPGQARLVRVQGADVFRHISSHHVSIFARISSRILCLEIIATDVVEPRRGHPTSGAVMNADEQDVLLCHIVSGRGRTCETRSVVRSNSLGSWPAS